MSRRRPLAVYLAIVAIALQALWPLLAQAKPKSVALVPVCTVQGVTHYIELPKGNAPVEQKAASQHDHCSFCSFGGERIALPCSLTLQVIPFSSFATAASDAVVLEDQSLLVARSRAPPAASR